VARQKSSFIHATFRAKDVVLISLDFDLSPIHFKSEISTSRARNTREIDVGQSDDTRYDPRRNG